MSDWNGKERRANCPTTFCSQHIEMLTQLTEVSVSLKGLVTQMTETNSFRRAIVISIISLVFAMFVNIAMTSNALGQLTRQVTVNTARLDVIEQVARDVLKGGVLK